MNIDVRRRKRGTRESEGEEEEEEEEDVCRGSGVSNGKEREEVGVNEEQRRMCRLARK